MISNYVRKQPLLEQLTSPTEIPRGTCTKIRFSGLFGNNFQRIRRGEDASHGPRKYGRLRGCQLGYFVLLISGHYSTLVGTTSEKC